MTVPAVPDARLGTRHYIRGGRPWQFTSVVRGRVPAEKGGRRKGPAAGPIIPRAICLAAAHRGHTTTARCTAAPGPARAYAATCRKACHKGPAAGAQRGLLYDRSIGRPGPTGPLGTPFPRGPPTGTGHRVPYAPPRKHGRRGTDTRGRAAGLLLLRCRSKGTLIDRTPLLEADQSTGECQWGGEETAAEAAQQCNRAVRPLGTLHQIRLIKRQRGAVRRA